MFEQINFFKNPAKYFPLPMVVSPYSPVILQDSSPQKQFSCFLPPKFLSIMKQEEVPSLPSKWLATITVRSVSDKESKPCVSGRLILLSAIVYQRTTFKDLFSFYLTSTAIQKSVKAHTTFSMVSEKVLKQTPPPPN